VHLQFVFIGRAGKRLSTPSSSFRSRDRRQS